MRDGLEREVGWGEALAFLGFLDPEATAKAETMEPLGSCAFEVTVLAFCVV